MIIMHRTYRQKSNFPIPLIFPCNYIIIFMGGDIVSSSRKKIIAVVTALANGFAEKELLRG